MGTSHLGFGGTGTLRDHVTDEPPAPLTERQKLLARVVERDGPTWGRGYFFCKACNTVERPVHAASPDALPHAADCYFVALSAVFVELHQLDAAKERLEREVAIRDARIAELEELSDSLRSRSFPDPGDW